MDNFKMIYEKASPNTLFIIRLANVDDPIFQGSKKKLQDLFKKKRFDGLLEQKVKSYDNTIQTLIVDEQTKMIRDFVFTDIILDYNLDFTRKVKQT